MGKKKLEGYEGLWLVCFVEDPRWKTIYYLPNIKHLFPTPVTFGKKAAVTFATLLRSVLLVLLAPSSLPCVCQSADIHSSFLNALPQMVSALVCHTWLSRYGGNPNENGAVLERHIVFFSSFLLWGQKFIPRIAPRSSWDFASLH